MIQLLIDLVKEDGVGEDLYGKYASRKVANLTPYYMRNILKNKRQ
ncbi:hypothetical protein DJ66_0256 [Candidatus Liberibacter solanacearum]|uniref:Uncharacterized protein n=1 Tax=Candidatus Liberibacter solanacearum TaxID=556287 RepID=A0A0F4VPQ3_9HYPH|nr:hypothetical protein DJ66_0256 [Candidatus Liberibacter solanacearum]